MTYVNTEIADKYQEFFNFMNQEHDLILTIEQMDEIVFEAQRLVRKLTIPIPIVSTRTFEEECKLYVDEKTDEWVFEHKGVIKKRSKSKFDCLIAKKEIQKALGV